MAQNRNNGDRIVRLQKAAEEPNFRGLFCNVPETYAVSDVARFLDQGVRRLRNRMMVSIPLEQASALLEKTMRAICQLEECTEEVAKITNMNWYKTPRGILRLRESMGMVKDKPVVKAVGLSD